MDIQISYENQIKVYDSISTYEDLIQEILNRFPILQDIELQYQDEEDDTIQVSNTSDLIAISDPSKVILTMTAKMNEQKIKELERQQKLKEIQQQKKLEAIKKKKKAIENEEKVIQDLTIEYSRLQNQFSQEILDLQNEIDTKKDFVPDQLVDFSEVIKESNLFDSVREKESKLLLLEDKKGFTTQLNTISNEISQIFRQLYQGRVEQLLQNYQKWNENKVNLGKLEQQIKKKEQEQQHQLKKLQERIQSQETKLIRLNQDLEKLEQGQQVEENEEF